MTTQPILIGQRYRSHAVNTVMRVAKIWQSTTAPYDCIVKIEQANSPSFAFSITEEKLVNSYTLVPAESFILERNNTFKALDGSMITVINTFAYQDDEYVTYQRVSKGEWGTEDWVDVLEKKDFLDYYRPIDVATIEIGATYTFIESDGDVHCRVIAITQDHANDTAVVVYQLMESSAYGSRAANDFLDHWLLADANNDDDNEPLEAEEPDPQF